jgi:hypothetical protein
VISRLSVGIRHIVKKKYNNKTLPVVKINPQFMSEDALFKFWNISNMVHYLVNMLEKYVRPTV